MDGKNKEITLLNEFAKKHISFKAALHHKSARAQAVKYLSNYGSDSAILDAWEAFGKATLSLFAARLTMNTPTKKNAASCSMLLQKLLKILLSQISVTLKDSNLSIFGYSVNHKELEREDIYHTIVYQLIGITTHEAGYNASISNFLKPLVDLTELRVPTGKDAKTTLQEYSQRRYKTLPEYTLLESNGPAHARTYRVKIQIKEQAFSGSGPTVRIAEHEAAIAYLRTNKIPWERDTTIDLNSAINYLPLIETMHPQRNTKFIAEFPRKLTLPEWSKSLIGLSLTHRSFNGLKNTSILGSDNTLLAFIGSHIIQWIASDAILSTLNIREITHTGGISVTMSLLVSGQKLEEIFDGLFSFEMLLLGPGERVLKPAMKVEFIQAFCGAIYLIREIELHKAQDFFHGISTLNDYFNSNTRRLCISREEALPIKTILQEQCQSIGIRAQYTTQAKKLTTNKKNISAHITLHSDNISELFRISGPAEEEDAHSRPTNAQLESNLAHTLKQRIDIFFGKTLKQSDISTEHTNPERWLLSHIKIFTSSFAKNRNFRLNQKLLKSNFLGTTFLREEKFLDFEAWYSHSSKLLSFQKLQFSDSIPLAFYEYAGQMSTNEKQDDGLNLYLSKLENSLISIDPLDSSFELRNSQEYSDLIAYASAYKVKGSPSATLKLSELIEQFYLLYKGTARINLSTHNDCELLEIQGAHFSTIDLLIKCSQHIGNIEINISESLGILTYTVTKPTNTPIQFSSLLKNNTLWKTLTTLLPIATTSESQESFAISVPAIITNENRTNALKIWWSFSLQGTSNVTASDMIAAMLHSLKNDILGYSISSLQAQLQQTNRERYQYAADASSHIERALTCLRAVRSLSKDTSKPEIAPLKIGIFLKSLISGLWAWIPEQIILNCSITETNIDIWTSKDSLHSILVNLIKNAVEALDGTGTITISYTVDIEFGNTEFLISDSGKGFNHQELMELNNGSPVKSSKKSGHGLGLLTVILLVKELNGSLHFFNGTNGSANIKVWIPSSPLIEEQA